MDATSLDQRCILCTPVRHPCAVVDRSSQHLHHLEPSLEPVKGTTTCVWINRTRSFDSLSSHGSWVVASPNKVLTNTILLLLLSLCTVRSDLYIPQFIHCHFGLVYLIAISLPTHHHLMKSNYINIRRNRVLLQPFTVLYRRTHPLGQGFGGGLRILINETAT